MSRELYVYSETSVPVKRSDLDEASEALGWKYFLFEDFSTFRKLDGGAIPSCTILGWEDEDETTAQVQSAVSHGDIKSIDELFTNELVASATIDLELPFVPDPEMLSELADAGVDEAIIRRISSARLSYSVRTSAGRNDLSMQLQDIVANLLAVALYGVLEDPQTGEFENLDRDLLEDDS